MVDNHPEIRFQEFFRKHYAPIAAYVRRRSSPARGAAALDDLVADTFLVAWRRWSEIEGFEDPLPWLYGVAANVMRNHRRSTDRALRLVTRIGQSGPAAPTPADPGDVVAADDQLVTALGSLPEDDQEILRLTAWEGLDRHQIAVIVDCSPDAVSQRLSRARRRLKSALSDGSGSSRSDEPLSSDPTQSHQHTPSPVPTQGRTS